MADDKERTDQINNLANGLGASLLNIVRGDWDLALSVATTLFASCVAQSALEHGDNVEDVFNECGEPARAATMAFYAEFKRAEETEDDQDGND